MINPTVRDLLNERKLFNSKDLAKMLGYLNQGTITYHRQRGTIPEPAEYVGRWPAWNAAQVEEIKRKLGH